MNKRIVDNKELCHIELYLDEEYVGRVEYTLNSQNLVFEYIFVDPSARGRGIAKILADIAYNYSKEINMPVIVNCGVLRGILQGNEQFKDFNWA